MTTLDIDTIIQKFGDPPQIIEENMLMDLSDPIELNLDEQWYPAKATSFQGVYNGKTVEILKVEYEGKVDYSLHVDGALAFAGYREVYALEWIAENLD